MNIKEFLSAGGQQFLPNLSIDHVIIGYKNDQLKCLLLQIGEKWLLPGGFVKKDESVDQAAIRILKERTNLENPHLKFLSVFGDRDRQFANHWKQLLKKFEIPWRKDYWMNDRFVTLAFYSLVNIDEVDPQAGSGHDAVSWFSFDQLPDIWMDHQSIMMKARNRLKEDIKQEQITYNLLPNQFTMPELHKLYQIVLEEELDRSRFQKKMLSSGKFERLPKKIKESPGRNPYQYRLK
ncbi:MAG: NUDIX domain-containing protein [Marinoscillum sp.]